MQYQYLGQSGLQVSRLCLGTMNMGSKDWKPWIFDEAESTPIVKHALDNGVNFIDLADFYSTGAGEEVLGNIIAKHCTRQDLILATKVGYAMSNKINDQGHSRKHIMDGIDASLKRLKTDYIDLYMLHFFDVNTPIEETWQALDELVRAGKVRYLGVSTMWTWQLAKILWACDKDGWTKPINMQLQLNCAYREEQREMIPFCHDQGIGVSVFSPLARGILSCDSQSVRNQTDFFTHEMYNDASSFEVAKAVARVADRHQVAPAQIAQAWVLQQQGVNVMLVGADTTAQFDTAVQALSTTLDADDWAELNRCYTPCDPINDYTAGNRCARDARAPQGFYSH